jgi:LysM repeat protein
MSNSDNHTDQDFVMSDEGEPKETLDNYEYETEDAPNAVVRKPSMMPAIITAVGFLVLIIFAIAILSRTQDLAENNQLKALESRLEKLEKRLAGAGDTVQQSPESSNSEKQFALLTERLDRLESDVNSKMDHIIKTLENRKQTPAQQPSPAAKSPPPEKKEKKAAKPKIHKVQAGETPFRISQRYGLTVGQLLDYNNLGPNAKIYPGQDLKLTP